MKVKQIWICFTYECGYESKKVKCGYESKKISRGWLLSGAYYAVRQGTNIERMDTLGYTVRPVWHCHWAQGPAKRGLNYAGVVMGVPAACRTSERKQKRGKEHIVV